MCCSCIALSVCFVLFAVSVCSLLCVHPQARCESSRTHLSFMLCITINNSTFLLSPLLPLLTLHFLCSVSPIVFTLPLASVFRSLFFPPLSPSLSCSHIRTHAHTHLSFSSSTHSHPLSFSPSQAVMLLYIAYLVYATRHVPKAFNESRYVALCLYNAVFLSLVVVLVVYGLGNSVSGRSKVSSQSARTMRLANHCTSCFCSPTSLAI